MEQMNGVRTAYDSIVAGIDIAMAGGQREVQTVKRDEEVIETVAMHGLRHYRVPLPSRPTAITVTVSRTAGAAPVALWGSTTASCERPTAKSHDLRGKDEKLLYEHAILTTDHDNEEAAAVDRRQAVPRCRDLFVTVEAEAGECTYRLSVHFGHVKIVLTRSELASQVQKIKAGWETRLRELQREPAQLEEFKEHVRQLQDSVKLKKTDLYRGKDFTEKNVNSVRQCTPRGKLMHAQENALRTCLRQDEVHHRRERTEAETEKRKMKWLLQKNDQREQSDVARQFVEKEQQRQVAWFKKLAAISFLQIVRKEHEAMQSSQQFMTDKLSSAGRIHQFVVRCLSYKRKNDLYKNVIRFRTAVTVYARVVRPAVACASQPVIRAFLDQYAFHRESPSLVGALHRFRSRVLAIQKWWQMKKRARKAFVSLFRPYWLEIQSRMCREDEAKEAEEKQVANSFESDMRMRALGSAGAAGNGVRKSVGSRKSQVGNLLGGDAAGKPMRQAIPGGQGDRKSVVGALGDFASRKSVAHGPGSSRRSMAPAMPRASLHLHRPMHLKAKPKLATYLESDDEDSEQDVPDYVVNVVLYEYITILQRTHPARVKAWQHEMQNEEFSKDVEGFMTKGFQGDAIQNVFHRPKPRAVYIDVAELGMKVRETIDEWEAGTFRWMTMNRNRLLRGPWKAWKSRARTDHSPAKSNFRGVSCVHTQEARNLFASIPRCADGHVIDPHASVPGRKNSTADLMRRAAAKTTVVNVLSGNVSRKGRTSKVPLPLGPSPVLEGVAEEEM